MEKKDVVIGVLKELIKKIENDEIDVISQSVDFGLVQYSNGYYCMSEYTGTDTFRVVYRNKTISSK